MGRPSKFTQELADEICTRLANGETLLRMCREQDHMPVRSVVSRWVATNPAFADRVASAREAGSHVLVEETRDIADDGANDWMALHHADNVGYRVNGEHVQRSKLRIEQRWREAEAILPRVYGKRQTIEHAGSLNLNISTATDDELMAQMLELAASGRLKLPGGLQVVEADDPEEEDDDDYSDIA